jgi:hypothetical protein
MHFDRVARTIQLLESPGDATEIRGRHLDVAITPLYVRSLGVLDTSYYFGRKWYDYEYYLEASVIRTIASQPSPDTVTIRIEGAVNGSSQDPDFIILRGSHELLTKFANELFLMVVAEDEEFYVRDSIESVIH